MNKFIFFFISYIIVASAQINNDGDDPAVMAEMQNDFMAGKGLV